MKTESSDSYNVKILFIYIDYLRQKLAWTDKVIDKLIHDTGVNPSILQSEENWFGQDLANRFHALCAERSDDPDIAYKVGMHALRGHKGGSIRGLLTSFIPPSMAYKNIGWIAGKYSRNVALIPQEITRNSAHIRTIKVGNFFEQAYQCRIRWGILQSIPALSGRWSINIEHPRCMHRGDDTCEYRISWREPKRASHYLAPLACGITGFAGTLASSSVPNALIVGAAVTGIVYSMINYVVNIRLRQELNEQSEAFGVSLHDIQRRHQEMLLINDITRQINRILPPAYLYEIAAETIYRKMKYDRVTIFQVDKTRGTLTIAALRGYSDIDQNTLKNLELSLANDHGMGLLATVVRTNQSVFVSDIGTVNTTASYPEWNFLPDVKSFIAAPISFQNEVYGIITVGRIGAANELANNDKELLANVARQFAVAFKNAIAHTQLQETNATLEKKVAERTIELIAARDEAIRAYQVKSLFLASMSHELRTPLNAIIGYSDMLREAALEDGLEDYLTDLTRIESNGQHLLALINGILNFSKLESGNCELTIEPFLLIKVLQDMEAIVIPLARENNNQLTIVNNLYNARLHGDAQKLKQILVNIVGNACKFTMNGRIDVHVSETGNLDRQWIIITVSDKGIGIDPAHLEHLFTAFYQGEDPLTKSHGGTGLGLAICKRFSMMMGGDISVKSAVGQGSTFTITIPRNLQKPSDHDHNLPLKALR